LVPILEVGAVASAVGWMSACASYLRMTPAFRGRAAACFGLLVTLCMVAVKVVPLVPGHFTRYEWIALAIWFGMGAIAIFPVRATYLQSRSELPANAMKVETRGSGV
jgi:hypothetical protein